MARYTRFELAKPFSSTVFKTASSPPGHTAYKTLRSANRASILPPTFALGGICVNIKYMEGTRGFEPRTFTLTECCTTDCTNLAKFLTRLRT